MVLNLYMALRLQLEMFQSGDCESARGVVPMIEPMIEGWQRMYMDPDVDADFDLIRDIDRNGAQQCANRAAVMPTDGHYVSCMFI